MLRSRVATNAQLFLWCQAAAITDAAAALASIGWDCAMKFASAGGTSAAKPAGKAAGSRYRKSSLMARISWLASELCERDEVDGWIERIPRYWEKRLAAMEHLLRELKTDHKWGPKDRKHGSR